MAQGRRGGNSDRPRKLAPPPLRELTGTGAFGKDFSKAPIFFMYGPSPSMTKSPRRWRNGATIPTREGQMKPAGAGRNKKHKSDPNAFKQGYDARRYTGKGQKRT